MNRDHSALLLVREHINDSRRVIGLPRTDLASTYFQYDSMPDISTNLPAIREITKKQACSALRHLRLDRHRNGRSPGLFSLIDVHHLWDGKLLTYELSAVFIFGQ